MSTLRISDAPLLPDVDGTEKIPTGGRGDYAISVDQIKGHIFQDVGKELVGLGNVDNTSDLDKPVSTAQQAALDLKADKTYVDTNLALKADKTNVYTRSETTLALSQKADLVNGVVPENQIPSSFNDVLEFTTPNLPIVGESGKIYITTDTNKTWRWATNKYVEISGWNPDSVSKTVTTPTYNNAADGVDPVTGVVNGAYFNVRSTDEDTMLVEYQNVGGSAVATGKRYLSALGVQLQEKAASTVKDTSGKTQQEINDARVVVVGNIADLIALPAGQRKEGLRYLVKEYHAGTGVGGGEFYWDDSSTENADEGTIIDSFGTSTGKWMRHLEQAIEVEMFGGGLNNGGADTNAFSKALDAAIANGLPLKLRESEYTLDERIAKAGVTNITIYCDTQATIRVVNSTEVTQRGVLDFTGVSSLSTASIRNVTIDMDFDPILGGQGRLVSIYLYQFADAEVVGCRFPRAHRTPIQFGSVFKGRIKGNIIERALYSGVQLHGSENIEICNNFISDIYLDIANTGSLGYGITSSTSNSSFSFGTFGHNRKINIHSNYVQRFGRKGIDVHNGFDIKIYKNTVNANFPDLTNVYGLVYALDEDEQKSVDRVTVEGNTLIGSSSSVNATAGAGVRLGSAGSPRTSFKIINNIIENAHREASIEIAGVGPEDFLISGNTITSDTSRFSSSGIISRVNFPPAKLILSGNLIKKDAGSLLRIDGMETVISTDNIMSLADSSLSSDVVYRVANVPNFTNRDTVESQGAGQIYVLTDTKTNMPITGDAYGSGSYIVHEDGRVECWRIVDIRSDFTSYQRFSYPSGMPRPQGGTVRYSSPVMVGFSGVSTLDAFVVVNNLDQRADAEEISTFRVAVRSPVGVDGNTVTVMLHMQGRWK